MGATTVSAAMLVAVVRDALVQQLAVEAGFGARQFTVRPIQSEGLINAHSLLEVGDERYVVRRYGWPWPGVEPFDRMAKEAWLLGKLEAAGVRAPRAIASARDGDDAALLLSYVDGAPLGTLDVRRDDMWRAAGAALREIHDADIGMAGSPVGMIIGGGRVDAFAGGWAEWNVTNTRHHGEALAAGRPDLGIDVERCVAIVEQARAALDAGPTCLIHTDANPWNVLITPDGRATWVDWEFAWWGDPLYDFVRMTFARKRYLGPLPDAYFEGYGNDPRGSPLFGIYELQFQLWMGHEALAPLLPIQVTYDNAERYLRQLPAHLDRLEAVAQSN
ncbi:MAG TPA: aminoglycoside phosphotransferase family protein [Acidimicrobiales bacterium]|nr:aminoglycoside phosphotransferase family protein [Acidimicrobiales bacterium]